MTLPDASKAGPRESILVVDDDKAFRVATQTLLEDEGYRVAVASNGKEAVERLSQEEFDLLLTDLVMGDMGGIVLLQRARTEWPAMSVIMVTGFGSIATAVAAMRLGANDYLTKPVNNEELLIKIRRALEAAKKDRELTTLREELRGIYSYGNIVTRSPKMRELLRTVQLVADTDVTVLIQGESGTGKELIARALHVNSTRQTGPFVVVNCSAIPENLLESELFGYEKGAFTGAIHARRGRCEEAHGGTLFLDEIGELPLALQAKLLRFLQEKTFERVGSSTPVAVETRVVAATNRNLDLMVRQGDFREDLFYRLNVFPIQIPPLRDRIEDIPLLAEHFLARYAGLANGRVKYIAPTIFADLMNYSWRGNIRELENLVKRAIIMTPGDTIQRIDLSGGMPDRPHPELEPTAEPASDSSFKEYLDTIIRDAEEKYLLRMLKTHKGNINLISRLMDVDRKTVYRKLAEYSIEPSTYRG